MMKTFKIKKKVFTILMLMITMLTTILTGCGQKPSKENTTVHIGSLKGPTSMGLVSLMDKADRKETSQPYEFNMATAADELTAMIVGDKLDIALVPANVASILYHKTEKGISVIDINTLGVLYMVSGARDIASISDLKGKTLYLTGKGTTPDYVLRYLLQQNGLSDADVTLEYKSEATEIAAILKENSQAIGLLPQPFAAVACSQNEEVDIILDLTEEWKALQGEDGSSLVTGVTIVRNEFLKEHKTTVDNFLKEHKKSTDFSNTNIEEAAKLVVSMGIIEQEAIAQKAMPYCNITYLDGMQMKTALSGYLNVLLEQESASIGGSMPDDDFYYIP